MSESRGPVNEAIVVRPRGEAPLDIAPAARPTRYTARVNFRVFSSEEELREGLGEAIDRVTTKALTPHAGIVGELPPWLGTLLHRSSAPLRLAGHTAPVQQTIESDEALQAAHERDLHEPLDLVVVIGPPPATAPSWLAEARARFVVVTERDDLSAWLDELLAQSDQTWFFILEGHWRTLIGNRNAESRIADGNGGTLNGDDVE